MDWSERLTAAVDYIENNLAGEIDFNKAAEKAACSTFHFYRMFFAVNGLTPAEYARRRRLTLAAMELAADNARVIDIALKYGYESPDAFTRAFRQVHGVNPQAARKPGVTLTAFPRISFYIELKGGIDMDYKILEKPAFQVAIKARQFTNLNGQNFKDAPIFWQEFINSPEHPQMLSITDNRAGAITGGEMLGVCYGMADTGDFYYGIAVELPEGASSGPFEKMEIPASTWAVFDCTLANIQDAFKQIFLDWYTSTGYEHPGTPDLEVYLPGGSRDDMKVQIWAPVVKKK